MIKNIILDVGGVILDDSAFNRIVSKIPKTKDRPSFRKCLLGKMGVYEYIDSIKGLGKVYEEYADVLLPTNYEKSLPIMNETIELIYELKKQEYKIYIFSNITEPTLEYLKKNVDFEVIDGEVCSHIEHLMKPDVKFYERLVEKYNLNKSETIFFDDKKKNIDIGNSIGIKSIQFKSISDILENLEK